MISSLSISNETKKLSFSSASKSIAIIFPIIQFIIINYFFVATANRL